MRKISLDKLDQLFAEISSKSALYIPVDTAAGAKFEKYDGTKKMSDALNTVRSAKDFFFPQTENLVDFKVEGKTIEIKETVKEDEDFVVFGVRACDVKSFEILDRVFLADPVDNFYKNRRDHGIIVSMACTRPAETCFCQTFGIDATRQLMQFTSKQRQTRAQSSSKALTLSQKTLTLQQLKLRKLRQRKYLRSFLSPVSTLLHSATARQTNSSTLLSGRLFQNHVSDAVHVHSYVRHASATTSRTSTQVTK